MSLSFETPWRNIHLVRLFFQSFPNHLYLLSLGLHLLSSNSPPFQLNPFCIPASVARSRQAFTATLGKNPGRLGNFMASEFLYHKYPCCCLLSCWCWGGNGLVSDCIIRNSSVDELFYEHLTELNSLIVTYSVLSSCHALHI